VSNEELPVPVPRRGKRQTATKPPAVPEETRLKFLTAGATLFAERGYLGTNMTDILSVAGVTKSVFGKAFATKEALALGIAEYTAAQWPPLIAAYEEMRAPAVDTAVAISFEVAELYRDDILVRAGIRLSEERDTIKAPLPPPFHGWAEEMERLLSPAGQRELMGLTVPAGVAARVIVTCLIGVQHLAGAGDERDEMGRRLTEVWTVMLPGLRPTPDPGARIAAAEALRRRVAAGAVPSY
jgi:AcrR family transcriptional regulator